MEKENGNYGRTILNLRLSTCVCPGTSMRQRILMVLWNPDEPLLRNLRNFTKTTFQDPLCLRSVPLRVIQTETPSLSPGASKPPCPKGPRTQIMGLYRPNAMIRMLIGTLSPNIWVLGPVRADEACFQPRGVY